MIFAGLSKEVPEVVEQVPLTQRITGRVVRPPDASCFHLTIIPGQHDCIVISNHRTQFFFWSGHSASHPLIAVYSGMSWGIS